MSALFTPYRLGSLELRNRIVIAPMCQYSADDGRATDWHLIHLGNLALSGAGLLIIEATAVLPEGRISPDDLGLWSDETENALGRGVETVRRYSDMPIAIQLAHAGRKASTHTPWKGGGQLRPGEDRGWQTVAPRPSPSQKARILRWPSITTGSPPFVTLSWRRQGDPPGSGSMRSSSMAHMVICCISFSRPWPTSAKTTMAAASKTECVFPSKYSMPSARAFPVERPVSMRVSGTDWAEGGWDLEQTIAFAKALAARGCNAIHVSSGGMTPAQKIPVGPSYQVPLARAVKAATNLPTVAVGLITGYDQAEAVIGTGDADFVALARTILYDPRWPWHAAAHLGATVKAPKQYLRSQPSRHRHLFDD